MATAAIGEHQKGWRLLKAALSARKTAIMLIFGFSAGLPFSLLVGTLNAWLGEAKVDLATIGIISWIGLAYAHPDDAAPGGEILIKAFSGPSIAAPIVAPSFYDPGNNRQSM